MVIDAEMLESMVGERRNIPMLFNFVLCPCITFAIIKE